MLLFIYGSLKRGFHNHPLLVQSGAKFIGMAWTTRDYQLISLGSYPGMVMGNKSVQGEIWEVEDDKIGPIDALEGHPHFYKREITSIADFDGPIYSYIYQGEKNYKRKEGVEGRYNIVENWKG